MCQPGPVDPADADSNACGCTVQVSFPDQDSGKVCVPYNLCKSGIPNILTTGQECEEYNFSDINPCTGTAPPTPPSTTQLLPPFPHYGPGRHPNYPDPNYPDPDYGPTTQPAVATTQPAAATTKTPAASDPDSWAKKHWWVILLVVLGALCLCYWVAKNRRQSKGNG